MARTPLEQLVEWSYAAAPADVRGKARMLVLDTLGCALAAHGDPDVKRLAESLDPPAFLATAACWDEACEGLARAHGRPGVPVVAAALPLMAKKTIGELLDAVVAGYEVGGRMGEALRIRPGMHVDAGWPSLGAAVAATRVLGGSPAAARDAIEIAAAQLPFSLYLPIQQGANARNTYLGHAAWLGTFAARAALAGCVAPRGAVERFADLALGIRALPAYAAPGEYVIREAYLKAHAAVRHVHYGAEAALQLRSEKISPIEKIELAIYPEAVQYCGNRAPQTPIQAQFSLSFGLAAALRFGRLGSEAYRSPRFDDPELRRLEALVTIRPDERLGEGGRRAAVLNVDGLETRVDAVKGDPSMPFTADECRAKFLANGGTAAVAAAILDGPESAPFQPLALKMGKP